MFISNVQGAKGQHAPSIKLVNSLRRVDGEDVDNMSKQCLPYSKLDLVQ